VSAEYGLQRPSPNVTVRVDSGVERVMIPGSQRPAAPQEAEFENPRGIAPAMNVTAKDYGSDGNYQRVQTGARENLGTPGADILGTATTPWGRAIVAASELKAESVVTVHGMTMQLRQAVHLGFVARDANGNYANIGAARPQTTMPQQPQQQPTQPNEQQQEQDTAPVEFEDAAAASTFATVMEQAPQVVDKVLADFTSKGEISDSTVDTFAQLFSLPREQAAELIQTQWHEHAGMVADVAEQAGVQDVQRFFYDFSRSGEPLKQAVYRLIHQRDASGFRRAAMIYKQNGGR
jgi:hypothetical protein